MCNDDRYIDHKRWLEKMSLHKIGVFKSDLNSSFMFQW